MKAEIVSAISLVLWGIMSIPYVLLVLSIPGAFYLSFRYLRHARLIEDRPTSNIRTAHQGCVELEGLAQPIDGGTITSPLSRTECVWWSYEIQKRKEFNLRSPWPWKTIELKTSDTPFYLADDTDRCLVNPQGAMVESLTERSWHGSTAWPGKPLATTGAPRKSGYRYTEQLILPGSPLYALGLFITRSVGQDEAEMKKALQETLAEWKPDTTHMDDPRIEPGGKISLKEREAARTVAKKELSQNEPTPASEGLHTLSKPPLRDQPFMLSTELQKPLAHRMRLMAGACFVWFLGGGALFLWALLDFD